jgi:asparaginyl-tRNA synthetase
MATNGHTLYGSKQDWHVWKVLVTAKYAKAKVTLQEAFDKAEVAKHAGTDRLPVLKTAEGIYLSQSNSMVRYIARVKSEANMYGTDAGQQSQIDGWIDFSLNELELPAAVWTYPLLGVEGYNPSDEAVAQAKVDVKAALDRLNSYLKDHTYLVGDLLSAADIALASACTNLYKLVMTDEDRAQYKAVTRWFFTCINQPAFQSVVGKVETSAPAGGAKVASTRKPVVAQGSTASAFSATQIKGGDNWKRKRMVIRDILEAEDGGVSLIGQTVTVAGWARSIRSNRFIQLNDGSTVKDIQCVLDDARTQGIDEVKVCGGTSACLEIVGEVVKSQGRGQTVEVQCDRVIVHGKNMDPSGYPMARTKKGHSMEFLREKLHLRPRTNIGACVTRVRNACAYATHTFFQSRGFKYIHTPLISGSDCEGAGEMFGVTTLLEKDEVPRLENGKVDYSKDFFKRPVFLSVSGQLNVECFACCMSDVYTFGPTFRAEDSHTSRHLAEFWMIEPEIAFANLKDDMALAEDYLRYCVQFVLDNCKSDIEFFEDKIEKGLIERLTKVASTNFAHLTYTDAVAMLLEHEKSGKVKFDEEAAKKEPLEWGVDLRSEHERYLCEKVYNGPLIVTDYPAKIKAFYMRLNDDEKTVQAMDILVPGVGEIIGGSVREERLDVLTEKIKAMGQNPDDYSWYLDLRKYGTVPHAGFGLGFERLVAYTTGMSNIRDVIPFPRWPGKAEF